jgi:hypothetical protein
MLAFLVDSHALRKLVGRALAFLLAFNYFAFRVELFSEEFEQNHPRIDSHSPQPSWSRQTLNWETFDKDNAPKAISVNAWISLELVCTVTVEPLFSKPLPRRVQTIRDKSPPPLLNAA